MNLKKKNFFFKLKKGILNHGVLIIKRKKISSFSSVEFWAPLMGTAYSITVCGWLPPSLLILPVAGGGTALGRLAGGL